MDPKTKQLIEDCERRSRSDTPQSLIDVRELCLAVKEQDKCARHAEEERNAFDKLLAELDESNASLSRKLGGLSAMLAAYGLPSEPKALAGAIERERTANRERIAELQKEVARLRIAALGA